MAEEKRNPELTVADLMSILAEERRQHAEDMKAIIAEMKKPSVVEQIALDKQAAEIAARQKERLDNAAAIKQLMAEKAFQKRTCTHVHAKTNDSHCVYIMEKRGPGYLLCQACQAVIRPGEPPEGNDTDYIYDTALFNRLFQGIPSNELFG